MIFFLIIFGLVIGSFVNNYISHLCGFSSFDFTRSTCFCNKRKLNFFELIPIVSYLILKGKCNDCNKSLSPRYSTIEIITPVIVVFSFYHFPILFYFLLYTSLLLSLLIAAAVDYYTFKIPNQIILFIAILFIVKSLYENKIVSINLLTPFVILFVFSIINFIHEKLKGKAAIGFGDIKLLMSLGLFFNLTISLLGIWISSIVALPGYLILNSYNKDRFSGNRVPFGIFISIAYTIILLNQSNILHYISYIGGY